MMSDNSKRSKNLFSVQKKKKVAIKNRFLRFLGFLKRKQKLKLLAKYFGNLPSFTENLDFNRKVNVASSTR